MSDDLVKRLRDLRSNQYADPNTAPEFVFLDPDLPPSEWEKQYGMDVIYVRADRIEKLEAENGILRTEKHADAEAIADLKTKLQSMALDCLTADGQASEAYQAQLAAEAKLAKAERFIKFLDENYRHVFGDTARQKIRELYAELKGENRG